MAAQACSAPENVSAARSLPSQAFPQASSAAAFNCDLQDGTHLPPAQVSSAAQTVPQPPQCEGSLDVSTQLMPHGVLPALQFAVQSPVSQSSVPLQAVWQVPQCVGSLFRSTHVPLQSLFVPQFFLQLPWVQIWFCAHGGEHDELAPVPAVPPVPPFPVVPPALVSAGSCTE